METRIPRNISKVHIELGIFVLQYLKLIHKNKIEKKMREVITFTLYKNQSFHSSAINRKRNNESQI